MFNISLPSILILILLALNLLLVIALWLRKPDETLQEQTQQTLQQEVVLSYITPLASTTLLIVVSGRSFSWSIGLATAMIISAAVMGMRAR